MCRVWLSVEDREFLLQKFRFAGFDHIARIRARQPRDMAARRLMLELDRASHIHLPAQQCGATLASPSSDHSSFNRLYGLWAGEEGLSGNTFCLVQIEVVVAVRQVQ